MDSHAADKVREAFTRYPKRTYPKGQILVFANENPEHIYYLVSGKVRKYDVTYRGDEVIVNIFKPPSFFPMSWAINRLPNTYFYKTEEPTEVHVVPADEAVRFITDNPDVMLDLLSRLYAGMEGLMGRIVQLMSGSAKSRLVYELIIESRRFGRKQPDGRYVLSANEGDLAARSGLSRETVSREMHKLKSAGLVTVEQGTISVLDLPMLSRYPTDNHHI